MARSCLKLQSNGSALKMFASKVIWGSKWPSFRFQWPIEENSSAVLRNSWYSITFFPVKLDEEQNLFVTILLFYSKIHAIESSIAKILPLQKLGSMNALTAYRSHP